MATINKGYREVTSKYSDQYSEWISTASRWQKIKYTKGGNPYIRHNNQRISLDEFVVNADGRAYHMYTYSSGLIAEIHPDGEYVKVSYTYTGQSSKAIKAEEEYRKNRGW